MSSSSETEVVLKKYRKQKFNVKWLENSDFKGWLKPCAKNEFKCQCVACGTILNCGKSELLKHSKTKKHKSCTAAVHQSNKIDSLIAKMKPTDEEIQVKNFEIRLSMFFAEHNVAIQIVDHLLLLLKETITDSDIIRKASLGRTKCRSVIKNVIPSHEKDQLIKKLQTNQFSVMIDESTDIGLNKSMCVLVRFFDADEGKVVVKLLDLLPVKVDCTAEALYALFKDCIVANKIPFTNILGMCSDGASVMIGKHNSFASRLMHDLPKVVIVKCICHSAAIIASKACLKLPRAPEDLLRQIGSYVMGSSKRCAQLENIQELFNEKKRKIVRTCTTRWLAHQKCVESILDNWDALKEFFKQTSKKEKLKSTELILSELSNKRTKAYLLFLKYVLGYFNAFNALFQSKKPLIQILHTESVKLFMQLGQNFIKKGDLKVNCDVRNPHILLPTEEAYFGNECNNMLETLSKPTAEKVRLSCIQFYVVALEEIQRRLPLKNNTIFTEMRFLSPDFALGTNGSKAEQKFTHLCEKLNLDENAVLNEWRSFEYNFPQNKIDNLVKLDIEQFWGMISKTQNFNDEFVYPLLSKISKFCLSLPHANADSERIFSIITDVRTKKRNKLSHENLTSICIIRSYLKDESLDCVSFKCPESIYKYMEAKTVYDHH